MIKIISRFTLEKDYDQLRKVFIFRRVDRLLNKVTETKIPLKDFTHIDYEAVRIITV